MKRFSMLLLLTALLSALLLGESGGLGGRTLLALALVCLGILLVNRAPERKYPAEFSPPSKN